MSGRLRLIKSIRFSCPSQITKYDPVTATCRVGVGDVWVGVAMVMLVRVVGNGDGRLEKGHDDGIVVVAVVSGGPVCVSRSFFF